MSESQNSPIITSRDKSGIMLIFPSLGSVEMLLPWNTAREPLNLKLLQSSQQLTTLVGLNGPNHQKELIQLALILSSRVSLAFLCPVLTVNGSLQQPQSSKNRIICK